MTGLVLPAGILLSLFILPAGFANADPCARWGAGRAVGQLDSTLFAEASGISGSLRYPDRLYHVNDSGREATLFVTDLEGNHPEGLRIRGLDAGLADVEDMALGPCGDGRHCLFLADIGDNSESRQNVEVLVVDEPAALDHALRVRLRLRLFYPDGAHNAEGFAVHPNGDLYILTKALNTTWSSGDDKRSIEARPARLYRLKRNAWIDGDRKEHRLEFAGTLDLPGLLENRSRWPLAQVVTSLAVAPDGQRFTLLTYGHVLEFNHDLARVPLPATGDLREGIDYRILDAPHLPYQEAITYLADGRTLVYHTEQYNAPQDIVRIDCEDH